VEEVKFEGLGTPVSNLKSLSKDDVALLRQNGIETVEALIFRRRELDEIFQISDETAKHNKIRNAVIEALTLKKMWMVSADEWAKVEEQQIVFDTGSNALNTILGGGIHSMSVAEFYGEFGVGKSQILNTTMVLALSKFQDRTAIYIDTEKTFHYGRIKQIAEARGFNVNEIINRIILLKPPTTEDLIEIIKRLYLTVEKRKVIMIVCDSLISHLRAEFLGREMLGPRQQALTRILTRLKLLAELYNIGVVTSNQAVAVPQATMTPFGDIKAAGGHIMAHNCLHPDTWVWTTNQLVKIKEAHNPLELVGFDNFEGLKLSSGVCTYTTPSTVTKALKINDELICTPAHTLFKYCNGRIVECEAEDVKIGDWLLVPAQVKVDERDIRLPSITPIHVYKIRDTNYVKTKLKEKGLVLKRKEHTAKVGLTPRSLRRVLNDGIPTSSNVISKIESVIGEKVDIVAVETAKHKLVRIPETVTPALAQIFGYWLADGNTGLSSNEIEIKDSDLELLNYYKKLFEEVFNVKPKVRKGRGKWYSLRFANKYVAETLRWLKENYTLLSNAPEKVVAGFLRGYFDGEGCARNTEITLSSVDWERLLFIKMLLLRFGIISSVRKQALSPSPWTKNQPYTLSISGGFIDIFAEKIGFTSAIKNAKLKKPITRKDYCRRYIKLLNPEIAIRKVRKIEVVQPKERYIDITVEPIRNFIANGYFVHNTEPRVFVRKAGVSTRIARIEDSAWLPPAEATFKISDKGIEDVSTEG